MSKEVQRRAPVEKRKDGTPAASPGVYITHEQAARLYGDPGKPTYGNPNSVLGLLFDIKGALLRLLTKKGAGEAEPSSQLNKDFSDVFRFYLTLYALLSHGKDGGLFVKTGWGRKKPLGAVTEILPENTSLYRRDGEESLDSVMVLETRRFAGWFKNVFQMLERYKDDLGEAQYNSLRERLQAALEASGIYEGPAGLLPAETTAIPQIAGSAVDRYAHPRDDANSPRR